MDGMFHWPDFYIQIYYKQSGEHDLLHYICYNITISFLNMIIKSGLHVKKSYINTDVSLQTG